MANNRQKINIRIFGNDEVGQDELQRNWNRFLDIVLKKTIAENETPVVGQGDEEKLLKDN